MQTRRLSFELSTFSKERNRVEKETKTVKVIFENGKPVEIIEDRTDDFFKLFGEDVEKAWKKTKEEVRKRYE